MKLIFVFISVLLTALGAELVIRLGNHWVLDSSAWEAMYLQEPGRPYTFQPNLRREVTGVFFQTNSLGLRHPLDPGQIPAECTIILMMGGSITAGFGVASDDTFPQLLEKKLEAVGQGCFKVINAGQIAYAFSDIERLARVLVPIYRPKIVFYEINQFAWNDSYSINSRGEKEASSVDTATGDFFRGAWSIPPGPLDLEQPAPVSPRRQPGFLAAYEFFRPRVRKLLAMLSSRAECGSCLISPVRFVTAAHKTERLPEYSPLRLSPYYDERLHESVARAIRWTEGEGARTIAFTVNSFVDPAKLALPEGQEPIDISQIAGIPTAELFESHSLGWDPHLNPHGNEIVAQGLLRILHERNLVPADPVEVPEFATAELVERNRAQLLVYERQIGPFIDFGERRNLHQIVQGLYPEAIVNERKVAVILRKNGQRLVEIRGENFASTPMRLALVIGAKKLMTAEFELKKGPFQVSVPMDTIPDGIVDLQLKCVSEDCLYNRYDRIELR